MSEGTVTVHVTIDTSAFVQAVANLHEAMLRGRWTIVRCHDGTYKLHPLTQGPPPLCIDGHAYRRRVRNRRKS